MVLIELVFSGELFLARRCVGSNARGRCRFLGGWLAWWGSCGPFREGVGSCRLWRRVFEEFRPSRPTSTALHSRRLSDLRLDIWGWRIFEGGRTRRVVRTVGVAVKAKRHYICRQRRRLIWARGRRVIIQ
jgi:hypothetical protein